MHQLNDEPCPRCGCWMKKEFKCNCGAMHGCYCTNCGRYTAPTLTRDQYTEQCIGDAWCEKGKVYHEHTPQEQADRLKAAFEAKRNGNEPIRK